MEEPNEVHFEEDKVTSEKYKKRQLKTPAQVTALEEFYNANKYPSEEMKLQLSEQIGLTEKQVSGWFCHRRLKDKRLARDVNGRQDHSSERKQDSRGSTKHGDFRHVDPREVESPRFTDQHFPAAENAFELRSHYIGNFSGDDTSSESSSSLREGFNSQRVDPYDIGMSRYVTHNGNNAKSTGYKPAGYLKVKGNIENVAITSVKRQLGRNYREDGPMLGVVFQPLPPGAFESSIGELVPEPCDSMDQALLCSPDTPATRKQPRLGTRYDSHIDPQELHMEGTNKVNIHGSDGIYQRRLKQKSSIPGHANAFPVYNSKKKDRTASKLGVDAQSVSNRPYGAKLASEQTEAWLQESDYVAPKVVEWNEYMKSPPSNVVPTEERGICRTKKEDRLHVENKARIDPVRGKLYPTNNMAVPKRARDEPEQKDFVLKAAFPESPHQPNQTKGLAMEMPSSFSEDETAETSSSLN